MGMREIAPFGLRMPAELKERIDREAKTNGRSMNTEVIARLWGSLQDKTPVYNAMEPVRPSYMSNDLTEIEQKLLSIFRRMPVEKQLALVSLFK